MRCIDRMKPVTTEQLRLALAMANSEGGFLAESEGHVTMHLTWPDGTVIEHRDQKDDRDCD